MTRIKSALRGVLLKAWQGGFKTKSDFARTHAQEVAAAASSGLISTEYFGVYTDTWLITLTGLELLNDTK